jgi:hypothetical protein
VEQNDDTRIAAEVLTALAEEMYDSGLELTELDGSLRHEALGIELRVAGVDGTRIENGIILSPVFETSRYQAAGSHPMRAHVIGCGSDLAEAAYEAAAQWLEGIFPVLHSLYSEHKVEAGAVISEMITADKESGQRYGWKVHLGPVLMRVFGEGDEPEASGQADFVRCLRDEIRCMTLHDELFWLECYAAKSPGGEIDGECRLNNIEWPEGLVGIMTWANTWPYTPTQMVTKRQLIVFEPAPIPSLQRHQQLLRYLDGDPDDEEYGEPRSWWRRFLTIVGERI